MISFSLIPPPAHIKTIAAGVNSADYVLVPCQPSPADIEAIGDTLSLIEAANKPFACVLNRLISRTRIGEQALLLLANHGKIAGVAIEIAGDAHPEAGIAALWKFLLINIR